MISKDERARIEALAEKYVKKEKFQEAIDEYIKLLTGDEQDISIRNIIGDLYLKSGKKNKAVEELKKIAIYYGEKGLYSKSIAIYKRITRLDPDDYDSARKLADFYCDRGFISEAKTEYRKLAQNLKKNNKSKKAISMYEKLLKLDSSDIESRLSLAELYTKEKLIDQAVEELNEVAEFKMHTKELNEAEDILNKAKALKGDHSRTLANLIDLLKRKNKKKEALDLVSEILQKDKDNIKALYLLGNLYFEDKGFKEAEEIFSRIISIRPKEVEARVKLGRIYIKKGNFNQVFELYEPLVDTLIRKQKEEKAIGLLGLILAARRDHLSTLEKLASIYEIKGQKKNLEIVYKVILEEYKKKNLKEKSFSIIGELLNICPEVEEYHIQYQELRNELGVSDEAAGEDQPLVIVDEKNKVIEANLAKADLYIEQGLIRNAKRILENLRLKFPENLKIGQKIDKLKSISSRVKEEEIIKRVEMVSEKETKLFEEVSEAASRGLSRRSQEEQME
ncbi:MAG: tetratricopeptide repeat protein, partial [Candidatus Aminicenantes bacterium]|nr:tetratricopeptide repeat protein [Candidatus Aminicenantes bacterium]